MLLAIAAPFLLFAAPPQSFTYEVLLVDDGSPFNQSTTDNIDFGDVDLDGDWDVAMADGGDSGNDQNRIWINLGGLQGGTIGTFEDQTATRAPIYNDDSRDIEFADIDGDRDPEIYVSNTAQLVNQGNRWWVNQGGEQGGNLGFYADESAARWIGLNGPGSSIPPLLLIPNAVTPETFIDWSCDSDFGDLDNDGDLDLVHSSYGGAFGGQAPTRLFLNDGAGYFQEFNPSGYQLPGASLLNGNPGIWCEGVQTSNTLVSDGSECDITTDQEGIEIGDLDGDLDLDLLMGGVSTSPRVMLSRLEENGGTLIFRDVTGVALPSNGSWGGGFEQELGDLDGDDDLDIFGVNWDTPFAYSDVIFRGDGNGNFGQKYVVPNSGGDEQNCDVIDYDADGDLDLLTATFSGANRIHSNEGAAFPDVSATALPAVPGKTCMDVAVADLDNDGDYDFVEGNHPFANNRFFVNQGPNVDTTAPRIARAEAVIGHVATRTPDVVRAQIYDNAPFLTTYTNPTALEVTVDGIALPDFAMAASGAQIFRGEVPGNLVGTIEVTVSSEDRYGNANSAAAQSHVNTGPTGALQGPTTPGPGGAPSLRSLSAPIAGAPLYLATSNVSPGSIGFYLASVAGTIAGGLDLGDGALLNVAPPFVTDPIPATADANGDAVLGVSKTSPSLAGLALHAQALFVDGAGSTTWSSTQSLTLSFP